MKQKFIKSDRRNFIKSAVVAGGASVVAPAALAETGEAPVIDKPLEKDKGYQENDYIRKYYERARF